MRILIIEDEQKMSSYLHKGLTEASFNVDLANDGRHGLFLALRDDFDLIVLDVMLPEIDGFEVLKRLREQKQTQVLLLTARDAVDERVKGFELGADDYLEKPFAYAEFLARIRTLHHCVDARNKHGRTDYDVPGSGLETRTAAATSTSASATDSICNTAAKR
jgi:two-component system copper resistance phosphate regulon response regulator CusR